MLDPYPLSHAQVSARAFAGFRARVRERRALIVAYHNVAPTRFAPGTPEAFEHGFRAQLRALARMGTFVDLQQIVEAVREGHPLPPRAIALTFDDGYRDNLTVAVPILERMGIPATFYLVPGFLDQTVNPWWEWVAWAIQRGRVSQTNIDGYPVPAGSHLSPEAARFFGYLKELDMDTRQQRVDELVATLNPAGPPPNDLFMDWDDARTLASTMSIGSHTTAHAILARETPSDQGVDLRDSRCRLESELSVAVPTIAFPNGKPWDINVHTIDAVTAAGYDGGVTTCERFTTIHDSPFMLPRILMNPLRGMRGVKDVVTTRGATGFIVGRDTTPGARKR